MTFDVRNPGDGSLVGTLLDQGASDAKAAIDAAELSMPSWMSVTAKVRAQVLRRWHDLITSDAENLAVLIARESGKPLAEARAEVAYGASFVDWFAEEGKRAYGRTIPTTANNKRYLTIKQPVGICVAITPWNFPVAMITRKVAPALAAGCAIIVKPSEETPLSAIRLAELAQQAGVPPGVFSVVAGLDSAGIGGAFCIDTRVRKLSFTGSTRIGKLLYAQCAASVKRLSLELGGNAPFIVFDDADLEAAIPALIASKFRNAGQTCVCANRVLVADAIHEPLSAALTDSVAKLKVAPGLAEDSDIGPLINGAAKAKVADLVSAAEAAGAKLIQPSTPVPQGNFYPPTILDGVTREMTVAQTEIFGPVVPIIRFSDEAEAIAIANDTTSGLAAYLFTENISRAFRVGEALAFGMVGVNEGLFSNEVSPFGGWKESGIGREGPSEGLEEYLETKYLCLGGV
jgi:succinate-semialdehyde dehydrogenase/glutarate-semialdehyde dehydrogenase